MAENKRETVTTRNTFVYGFLRVFATVVFHTLMPVRFHHRERLDADPPFIMIANHQHALDPVVMALGVRHHQVVFLGKKELGKNAVMRFFMRELHCILVDRHHTDMEAMRACMKAIKLGKPLLIFPEGTRHHEGQMEQIENGTALIALRSNVPIIPIYIDRKLAFFRITNLYVGEPIRTDDLREKGINAETCEEMNERMRETFRRMIRETEAGTETESSKKS